MEVRITKLRVAMAALFVLAGVGLASLLSPLVGTALATVGQVVEHLRPLGVGLLRKGRFGREAGCRRRRRAAERGRNGHGSSGCARVSVARKRGYPTRRRAFIAGPSASPINVTSLSISTDARERKRHPRPFCTPTTCRAAPPLAAGATFDGTIWHIRDVGDGVTPVSFTFPDAAAIQATRKHEGVPVRGRRLGDRRRP